MSQETSAWLNQYVLVGFTEERGTAWHYRASDQGDRPNHYPGAIPVEDVRERLFDWEALPSPVYTDSLATLLGNVQAAERDPIDAELDKILGRTSTLVQAPPAIEKVVAEDRQAFIHSKTGDVLGIFKAGYQGHQYKKWLLEITTEIVGRELGIGSAGLLKNGAVAWVSFEVPKSITTREGVTFRPNLISTTSFDGSLATTYKRIVTNVVCDNTHAAGLSEIGQQFKARHSKNSGLKIDKAREALQLVHDTAAEFEREVTRLCQIDVSDRSWSAFLDAHTEIAGKEKASRTKALKKQDELRQLWNKDPRVEPWKGTAWGVLQAVSTHAHHVATVRKGTDRAERNQTKTLGNEWRNQEAETLATLDKVLASV